MRLAALAPLLMLCLQTVPVPSTLPICPVVRARCAKSAMCSSNSTRLPSVSHCKKGYPMPTLRHLLATQPYIFTPLCYNPLSARLAEEVGFQAVYLGGGSYGATLTWTEAMLTVTELADMTHRCATTVHIPVIVDGAGGFGEPLHVMRTIREIEQAGGAAIEIEDQRIPKRAHHHKGLEHMISK